MLRSFVAMGKGASASQVFMASQIQVRGRRLGKFQKHLDVAIHYFGCVLGTIMISSVIPKNWEDSLDRRDRWIDFGKLWMYAILGIWGIRVQGILGQDILRMEVVYRLDWIVQWLMRSG